MIPDEARCRGILHAYEITGDYPDALKEVCILCGDRKIWNKRDGKVDEKAYRRSHYRDYLQPYGEDRHLFDRCYGQKEVIAYEKMINRKLASMESMSQARDEAQDALKTLRTKTHA